MFAKKVLLLECQCGCNMDCFDNPTTYLPYMEGKAMFVALPSIAKLCCKHSAISCAHLLLNECYFIYPDYELQS